MTTQRLDAIKRMLTTADWDEVDGIAQSTDFHARFNRLYHHDATRAVNLAVAIYYRRMRRHDARFQSLFATK